MDPGFRPTPGIAAIDFGPALTRLAGDLELLKRQMGFFLEEVPQLEEEIDAAVNRHDARRLHLAAHRLKGLLVSYDQHDAIALAGQLETAAREADFAAAGRLADQLKPMVQRLYQAVALFCS